MSTQPLLLDLFCGAGGAGTGYARAGFRVVGVDLNPKPLRHNPHESYVGDALEVLDTLLAGETWQGYRLGDFAAIHASPPCQEYSDTRHFRRLPMQPIYEKPMLVGPIYRLLRSCGVPWVIENVDGAPMPDAIVLCGSMFDLPLRRHRQFASSHILFSPGACQHTEGFYNVIGGSVKGYGAFATGKKYRDAKGTLRRRESKPGKSVGQTAMGIDWMTIAELSQAIPPAYTHWIGTQLMTVLEVAA